METSYLNFNPYRSFLKPRVSLTDANYIPPPQHTNSQIKKHKYIKYKCFTEEGYKLAAGGIFFYEERPEGKGIWLIEEVNADGTVLYTDFGGKYDYNDGDIIATISREFREEVYNCEEINYKKLSKVPRDHYIYIDGYDGNPTYLCVAANIKDFDICLESMDIQGARQRFIKANPTIDSDWYKTMDVKFLLLKDINEGRYTFSNRFAAVYKNIMSKEYMLNKEIEDFFEV